jgi:hypothetical protein
MGFVGVGVVPDLSWVVTGKGVTEQLVFDYLCSVNAKFILRV